VNGKWRRPKLNARALKKLHTAAMAEGRDFPIEARAIKTSYTAATGRKHVRLKQERLQDIAKKMKKMPEMMEEYYEEKRKLRHEKRVAKQFFEHPL